MIHGSERVSRTSGKERYSVTHVIPLKNQTGRGRDSCPYTDSHSSSSCYFPASSSLPLSPSNQLMDRQTWRTRRCDIDALMHLSFLFSLSLSSSPQIKRFQSCNRITAQQDISHFPVTQFEDQDLLCEFMFNQKLWHEITYKGDGYFWNISSSVCFLQSILYLIFAFDLICGSCPALLSTSV